MITSTFSGGGGGGYFSQAPRKIATTDWDINNSSACTIQHSGTSAATPIASGTIALAIDANPCLTWRDILWLLILTANPDLTDQNDSNLGGIDYYMQNAAGLKHSHHFGFGALDASKLVAGSLVWRGGELPLFQSVRDSAISAPVSGIFTENNPFVNVFKIRGVKQMNILEQIKLTVTVKTKYRGCLEILLFCPESGQNVKSNLATPRKLDDNPAGFENWSFSTIRCFGELVNGNYLVQVYSKNDTCKEVKIEQLDLTLYGNSLTREEFTNLQNLVDGAEVPGNREELKKLRAMNGCNITEILDGDGYYIENDPTWMMQGKFLKWIKILTVLMFAWSVYCVFDIGFLDSEAKEEYRKLKEDVEGEISGSGEDDFDDDSLNGITANDTIFTEIDQSTNGSRNELNSVPSLENQRETSKI